MPDHGVAVIGQVLGGLPHLGLPALHSRRPGAEFGHRSGVATKYDETPDDTDLVGLGLANLAAAATGTLPRAVLAAVVFLIGLELVDVAGRRRSTRCGATSSSLRRSPRCQWWVLGVEQGIVVLAIAASIADHLRHSYAPSSRLLAPAGEGRWRSLPVVPGARSIDGPFVYRQLVLGQGSPAVPRRHDGDREWPAATVVLPRWRRRPGRRLHSGRHAGRPARLVTRLFALDGGVVL